MANATSTTQAPQTPPAGSQPPAQGQDQQKPPPPMPGLPTFASEDVTPPSVKKAEDEYKKKEGEKAAKAAKPPPPRMGQVMADPAGGNQRSIYEDQPGSQIPGYPEHEGYAKDQQHLRGSYLKDDGGNDAGKRVERRGAE